MLRGADPRLAVLVDARNVLRSTWPNLEAETVVAGSAAWAAEHGGRAVVVFDGTAPGGVVGVSARGGAVVVGTGTEESADDWLTRAASRFAARERPYWLVTSDRALRAAAGGAAERLVGGGALARELRARGAP
ncbi:MAG: NYN domain-containing protein [Thermoleophilia bacterium]|nr:NYN domain-containing protein [Thermoleophilia bacterium]